MFDMVSVFPLFPAYIADCLEEFDAPFVDRFLAVLSSVASKLKCSPPFSSQSLSKLSPSDLVLVFNRLSDILGEAAHLDWGLGPEGGERSGDGVHNMGVGVFFIHDFGECVEGGFKDLVGPMSTAADNVPCSFFLMSASGADRVLLKVPGFESGANAAVGA